MAHFSKNDHCHKLAAVLLIDCEYQLFKYSIQV